MQAVVLEQFGAASRLAVHTVPDPRPGPGEVLLRVHACGVCYHDVINRRGSLPRTSVPAILGHEVAGTVVEVGEGVTGWRVGDRAATLQRMSCGECASCRAGRPSLCRRDARFFGEELAGGYASLMAAPVTGIARIPDGMPWEVAATVCCTAGTAVHVVRTRGRIGVGENVLVTGASGGVGLQTVQLARLHGARVLAVTSSEAKVPALREAGANEVIVAPALQFAPEVRRLTGGEGVQVAIEIVGSATFAQTLKAMAPGGRVVVVGNLESGTIDLNPGLLIVKELEILGAYATTQIELETALRLVHEGLLAPFVTEVLPLCAAAEAHHRLENREVAGRLVLSPDVPPRSPA
jgi:D-arabinose 1-dehydrogenase-like Zn-dependent alcohol dehydrogenase